MRNNKILLSIIIITAIALSACSGSAASTVGIYDIQKAMIDAGTSLPDMTTVNSNEDSAKSNFAYLSDIDYSKVDSYFLSYSTEGLADEIAVIKLKKQDDMNAAAESLRRHAQGRVSLYTQYDPTQTKRAESAKIFSTGNYAVLIISDDEKAIQKALEDLL